MAEYSYHFTTYGKYKNKFKHWLKHYFHIHYTKISFFFPIQSKKCSNRLVILKKGIRNYILCFYIGRYLEMSGSYYKICILSACLETCFPVYVFLVSEI